MLSRQKFLQNGIYGYIFWLNKPSDNINKFSWQKKHTGNLTGTKDAHKPEGSLASDLKKNMKKYETWKS